MKIPNYQVENYINNIANEKIAGCLLYGPEATITRFRFEVIAKKIVSNLADPFLVCQLSDEKIKEDKAILADEFYSIAMLGGRRLIMIKNCDSNTLLALKILLADPQYGRKSDNFILMLGGDLDKSSGLRKLVEESQFLMAIPCYEESSSSARSAVVEAFKIAGINPQNEVINLMVKNFSKDRNLMLNEVNKINNYLGDKRDLNLDTLVRLISINNDENLYDFAIKFANKNYEECLRCAEKALETKDESMLIIRGLINYFTKLYNVKIAVESCGKRLEESIKAAQIFFKNEDDFKKHLQNLSLKFIIKSLQSFERLEVNLKKGDMSQNLVLLSYIRGYMIKKYNKIL